MSVECVFGALRFTAYLGTSLALSPAVLESTVSILIGYIIKSNGNADAAKFEMDLLSAGFARNLL
jgi:hypothetical protein